MPRELLQTSKVKSTTTKGFRKCLCIIRITFTCYINVWYTYDALLCTNILNSVLTNTIACEASLNSATRDTMEISSSDINNSIYRL